MCVCERVKERVYVCVCVKEIRDYLFVKAQLSTSLEVCVNMSLLITSDLYTTLISTSSTTSVAIVT